VEEEAYGRKRMRLMIQITEFLEILISCILGAKELWLCQWANQLGSTP
jgi:hypothetical protein